jgi:K+-transporting ATPase A subunit
MRKYTLSDAACLVLFLPVCTALAIKYGDPISELEKGSRILWALVILGILTVIVFFWRKCVPTLVSLILAAIVWPAFIWWMWHQIL